MADNLDDLITGFLTKCRYEKMSRFTINRYKYGLKKLRAYLHENDLIIREVGIYEAQEFKGFLLESVTRKNQKYSNNYIVKLISCASKFYKYLVKKKEVFANPFEELAGIREEKHLPGHVLKEKEAALLLDELCCFTSCETARELRRRYRTHVIAELQYSTGMRMYEVIHLKESDIDWGKGTITVSEPKGGKQRIVFLNDFAKQVLYIYIHRMRNVVLTNISNKHRLFGAAGGKFYNMINGELKKTAGGLGLGRLTSHGFRHAFGYHFLRAGCDLRYIQQLLGHEAIRSTEVYTKVDKEDLKEILDTYHPRRNKKTVKNNV